ncbi:hypothetical protein [Streptomyces sp. OV198]|jgi:hypothetical protein|uniref:hypothetical protein n=1 Tax=Streptomyces sp. OV198 TaxID=1882787 RepID=UPI0015CF3692|nr:hypothetical protein [Streptomyces sp. OV198]
MRKVLRVDDLVHIGDEVHLVSGSNTNWVTTKEDDNCTLVVTGYPVTRTSCWRRWTLSD